MDSHPPTLPPGALTRLDACLLGRFAVAIDGVELAAERWPSLRATQLVQLLCLQPHQRLTRDEVIDALWPQLDPEAGGANLRKAALDAGVNPYKGLNNINNCGGIGQCGTCVVEVLEGVRNLSPRSDVEEVYLADRPANYRLSCRTSVNGDVTVRTSPESGVGKGTNSLVGALKALVGRK
jgi:ferredoxin